MNDELQNWAKTKPEIFMHVGMNVNRDNLFPTNYILTFSNYRVPNTPTLILRYTKFFIAIYHSHTEQHYIATATQKMVY